MKTGILFIVLMSSCFSWAQFKVEAKLDTADILIGQQTYLRFRTEGVNNPAAIEWPDFRAALPTEIALIETSAASKIPGTEDIYELSLLITSWDSGYFAIAPFSINYLGTAYETEALLFTVNNVAVDLAAAPKTIKGIYDEPFSFVDWVRSNWLLLVCIVLGSILILLIFKLLRTRKSGNPEHSSELSSLLPHELALKRLELLSKESTYKWEDKKPFFSDLTEILREYLEGRFYVPAIEQTSGETLESVRHLGLDQQWQDHFRSLLHTADMVKFAKESTNDDVAERLLNRSKEFILVTLPVQTSEEDE